MKHVCTMLVLIAILLPLHMALSAESEHGIMRPDSETRMRWMKEELSLPKAYIDPAIKLKRDYLTSRNVMYPYPAPYLPRPIVISQPIAGMYLTALWWRNVQPGTYYLEGGGVDAAQPVIGGAYNYIGPVHQTALTLD